MNRERQWKQIRDVLKERFYADGRTTCELGFKGCMIDSFLGFAHRHPRSWYYRKDKDEEARLLGSRDQVLLSCQHCHMILDDRSKTTEAEKESIFESL